LFYPIFAFNLIYNRNTLDFLETKNNLKLSVISTKVYALNLKQRNAAMRNINPTHLILLETSVRNPFISKHELND
jgi:hypothetical protein